MSKYDHEHSFGEWADSQNSVLPQTASAPVETPPLCRIAELARFIKHIADEKDTGDCEGMVAGSTAIISIRRHSAEILEIIRDYPFETKIRAMEMESVPVETDVKEIAEEPLKPDAATESGEAQGWRMEMLLRAADKMAWICDDWVSRHVIDSRSALADARLNYGKPFHYEWSNLTPSPSTETRDEILSRMLKEHGCTCLICKPPPSAPPFCEQATQTEKEIAREAFQQLRDYGGGVCGNPETIVKVILAAIKKAKTNARL